MKSPNSPFHGPQSWLRRKFQDNFDKFESRPQGWPEKIFKFSIHFSYIGYFLAVALGFITSRKPIGADCSILAKAVGGLFLFSIAYVISYASCVFVKNRAIKIAWFSLLSLVILIIILSPERTIHGK